MTLLFELIFNNNYLAPAVLRQLPCMRDVAALALTCRFTFNHLQRYLPSIEGDNVERGQFNIFKHILIQALYRSYPMPLHVLSLQDAKLSAETERACLMRNYMCSISPRVALDLDCLMGRFDQEYGSSFARFMSFDQLRLQAFLPFLPDSSSLLRLRAEFCKRTDPIKLLAFGENTTLLFKSLNNNRRRQADELHEVTRKISEISQSLGSMQLSNGILHLEPFDNTAVLATCVDVNQSNPDQGVLKLPFTYNPWKQRLESRCVPRRGLRLLPSSAINLQHS